MDGDDLASFSHKRNKLLTKELNSKWKNGEKYHKKIIKKNPGEAHNENQVFKWLESFRTEIQESNETY